MPPGTASLKPAHRFGALVTRCGDCGEISPDQYRWHNPEDLPLWLLYTIRNQVIDGTCPDCS
jgi:hypothetical protein